MNDIKPSHERHNLIVLVIPYLGTAKTVIHDPKNPNVNENAPTVGTEDEEPSVEFKSNNVSTGNRMFRRLLDVI